MADIGPFRVELALVSGAVVVRVFGELDYFSGADFKDAVFGVVDGGAPRVAVDLTGVSYIDSTGLGVLIGAGNRAAAQGTDLVIVCPPGSVARIFEITGLDRALTVVATCDEALGGTDSGTPH